MDNRRMLIHGSWVESVSAQTLEVLDPATGKMVATVPSGNAEDVDSAVHSALAGFSVWRKTPAKKRAEVMHRAADLIRQHSEEVAWAITSEMGKPIRRARSEVVGSASLFDYFAEEGLRVSGELPQLNLSNEQVLVVKEPVGVVGAITPSNYPIALLTWKLGAALACGCSVVAKPDEHSPSAALLLGKLFLEADLPPGVLNVVTGTGPLAGGALVTHPHVRKIAFTGSVEVGQRIAADAARTCKRVSLELGGQCPAIVMRDVNISEILGEFVSQTFNNSGQYCYRINRAYVHVDVYDEFMDHLVEAVSKLKVGPGREETTDLGPLVHKGIFERTLQHIEDALSKGARLRFGGTRLGGKLRKGFFVQPAIIEGADHTMLVMREETFGPVLAVKKIATLREGIELANDTRYGLAAFVFTGDAGTGLQAAREIEAGSVWVNRIHKAYEVAPFGGMKHSGYGREKSKYGLDEYLELKAIYLSLPSIE